MVVCGYVRTSRQDLNPENQIKVMVDNGVPIENIFIDTGISGIIVPEQREGYSRMLKFIKDNKVEELYVFEISRLGRSFSDTLVRVVEFEKSGVRVVSLSPAETWMKVADKNIRDLFLVIFAWVAERERENLIERTKAGQARARMDGKHIGRPCVEINWKKVDEYLEKGVSLSATGRLMNIPYTTLLRKHRERKHY